MGFGQVEWTSAEVEELKRLWASGDSASVIGRAMGKTRNAILGKVHRLGLEGREHRNGSFYAEPKINPLRDSGAPKKIHRRSIINTGERKPKLEIINPNKKPALIAIISPITGAFASTKRVLPHQPEYTKAQLRAQLTQAVLNTARMA